ncbi:MAG: hypothetical protein D4R68_06180 [Ignavibacteriales bacterium]|nr:MAG: hypothetical protein D4R68_06180 [Ignavibacteriales bacterium]
MKKSFTLFTIVLLLLGAAACSVQAQYATKGATEIGGSVSYSSTTQVANGTAASNSTSLFSFMPYANYFITNGFSLGVSPGINIFKAAGSTSSTTYLLLAIVPGYTFSTKSNIFPFIEGVVGYGAITTSGSSSTDVSGISFGGKGGIKVLVGQSGLFSAGLSYMLITLNPKNPPAGADKRNGFDNFALSLGFSVFIQ